MAITEELSGQQIDEVLRAAAEERPRVVVSVRTGKAWRNYGSRLVSLRGGHVLLAGPTSHRDSAPPTFSAGQGMHLSFRLGHFKYTCHTKVLGVGQVPVDGQAPVPALCVWGPRRMQKHQRRLADRIDVPDGLNVPASFWLGDKDSEPADLNPERPIWPAKVTDLSTAGLRLLVDYNAAEGLEFGDRVGVRIELPRQRRSAHLDAVYRHLRLYDQDSREVLMGFGVLDFEGTGQGRDALESLIADLQAARAPAMAR